MRPSIYVKTFVPILLVILIYAVAFFFIIIPFFSEQLLNQKKEAIKELTVNSISLISYFDDQVEKGELDLETAKTIAMNEIKSLRYGKDLKDYFWIIDTTPKVIMQPYQPQITGNDLSDYKSDNGSFLFLDIVEMVKRDGSGFVDYKWQWKDDSLKTAKKISYVHLQPKWGWIVGSGIYVDEVEDEITAITQKIIYFSIVLIVLAILLAFYILMQFLD